MLQPDRFDVTVMLDYYTPYVSGLTEAARLTAEGLAARGWKVAVVCYQHDPELARHEVVNGVHVFRAPVLAKISRGFISPQLPLLAGRLAARRRRWAPRARSPTSVTRAASPSSISPTRRRRSRWASA